MYINIYMYIYIYVCMYVHVCVCVCIHTYNIHIQTCMHRYITPDSQPVGWKGHPTGHPWPAPDTKV